MIRITTLIENKKGEHLGLNNEHGLSFYIEIDSKRFLFDTGQSSLLLDNAKKLNINLGQIDHVVLSHGHYDHTGGFKSIVKEFGSSLSLCVHPDLFTRKYRSENEVSQFLGNDFDEEWLLKNGISIKYITENVVQLTENTYIVSNFDRVSKHEKNNSLYKIKKGNEFIIDDFRDEISIVLRTPKGLVLLLGCAHPGIENIIRAVINRLGDNIYAVLGGTHLVAGSTDRIKDTIDFIKDVDIAYIGVSHCTGEKAVLEFEKEFKDRYFYICTGTTLVF